MGKDNRVSERSLVPAERIEHAILFIRSERVMLDLDIAELYGVPTKRLNEQVKRNRERFPDDFMFQLKPEEKAEVVAKCDHLSRLKFSPTLPYAFTEHGAIMAASVLNTPRAVEMSLLVVRAFVKFRNMLATHRQLSAKLGELERKLATHDQNFVVLFDAIRSLMAPPAKPKRRIGFSSEEGK